MAQELQDIMTPVQSGDMLYALAFAWINLFNEQPKKESLVLLLSHISLECGINFSGGCHCYNYGNIKYSQKFKSDYVYFKCNELMPIDEAKRLVGSSDKDGGQATITGVRPDNMAWIWFYPKNPGCKFAAFNSKEDGALFYLSFLKQRYSKAPAVWQAVLDANPDAYIHNLKLNGYFTVDENIYKASVIRLYKQFINLEYDPDKLPAVSDTQKEAIQNLIGLTMDETSDDMILDTTDSDQT